MRPSSLVLLSGGLDSYASFHWASQNTDLVGGLFVNYGQKASQKELEAAKNICVRYDVKFRVVELPFFSQFSHSSLTNANQVLPELSEGDLDNLIATRQSADSVWVPNRNGILINVAAAFAENELVDLVVVGFNAEEAQTFPDNSNDFVKGINEALSFSTRHQVQVAAPMGDKNKLEIVKWLIEEEADLSLLWSCYLGDEKMCGLCESCQRLKRALKNGGGESWLPKLF
ncbi:MAG: hypothetical protein ACD_73C00723G0003 [uncultured bacterium]|nr:MAG: hypothetical protein ACD_73C00723G0003 [uncultured bacterium]